MLPGHTLMPARIATLRSLRRPSHSPARKETAMLRLLSALTIAAVLCGVPTGAQTPSSRAGLWNGRGHAVRTANLDLVTITITYDSHFWFIVAADDTVKGEATVTYELNLNDSRLRSRLALGNAAGNAGLGMVPNAGGLLALGLASRDAIGMRMSYDEKMPVRKGAISGSIANGRIALRWTSPPQPIGYQKYAIYPMKERPMTAATHPAYTPWLGEAVIAEPVPGQLLAATSPDSSMVRRGEVTFMTAWTADKRPSASSPDPQRRPRARAR
jgi:hypothetical protein